MGRGVKRYCERFATPEPGHLQRDQGGRIGIPSLEQLRALHVCLQDFYRGHRPMAATRLQIGDRELPIHSVTPPLRSSSHPRIWSRRQPSVTGRRRRARPSNCPRRPEGAGPGRWRILGLETADPEVARRLQRHFRVDPEFGVTELIRWRGFQFGYAHMGIYRERHWTATMRGLSSYIWGAEIYNTANRYGRYQSYGAFRSSTRAAQSATAFR